MVHDHARRIEHEHVHGRGNGYDHPHLFDPQTEDIGSVERRDDQAGRAHHLGAQLGRAGREQDAVVAAHNITDPSAGPLACSRGGPEVLHPEQDRQQGHHRQYPVQQKGSPKAVRPGRQAAEQRSGKIADASYAPEHGNGPSSERRPNGPGQVRMARNIPQGRTDPRHQAAGAHLPQISGHQQAENPR